MTRLQDWVDDANAWHGSGATLLAAAVATWLDYHWTGVVLVGMGAVLFFYALVWVTP